MSAPRGLYTPVYGSLPRHPKTARAAKLLGVSRQQVVGHLVSLWTWCLYSVPVDRAILTAPEIALASEWPEKSALKFAIALADAGFLDRVGEDEYVIVQHLCDVFGRCSCRRPSAGRLEWASLGKKLRAVVFARDGRVCRNCGSFVRLEVDHVVPLARGGSNDLANLQVLCRTCNRSKGASV